MREELGADFSPSTQSVSDLEAAARVVITVGELINPGGEYAAIRWTVNIKHNHHIENHWRCRDYLKSRHYLPANIDNKLDKLTQDAGFARSPSQKLQPTLFTRSDNNGNYTITNSGSGSITINLFVAK